MSYQIQYKGQTFPASTYQEEIFKAIETGSGNMIINASAGASKTTTIINALRYIPDTKKVLFVAFNKDIVKSIEEMVDHPNANIMTFHSLGYSILRENKIVGDKDINEFKYQNHIKDYLVEHQASVPKQKYNTYLNNIKKLVEFSRYYLAMTVKEINKIALLYDIVPIDDECEVCREMLLWGKSNTDEIDFTDMVWLPNVLNLTTKKYQYNWIFIDEAQDTSVAQQEMIEKCFKRGARFCIIGDEYQQINIWAGSSEDAIKKFKEHANTKEYQLPISYRCPKSVVNLARKYSPNIVAQDNAVDGSVNYDVNKNAPVNGDMVLCRTTSPLIELYLNYLRLNKKAYIRGFESIKEKYMDILNRYDCHLIDRNCVTSNALFPLLWNELFALMDKVKVQYDLSDSEVLTHYSVIELYDSIIGLNVISEGLTTMDQLREKVEMIFNEFDTNGIQLSTIHKAKGLEADNVYILRPSLLPYPLASKSWEIKTESNLIYVAYTRAKKTLNFINEDSKYSKSCTYWDSKKIVSQINQMKEKLNFKSNIEINEKELYANMSTRSDTFAYTLSSCDSTSKHDKKETKTKTAKNRLMSLI